MAAHGSIGDPADGGNGEDRHDRRLNPAKEKAGAGMAAVVCVLLAFARRAGRFVPRRICEVGAKAADIHDMPPTIRD